MLTQTLTETVTRNLTLTQKNRVDKIRTGASPSFADASEKPAVKIDGENDLKDDQINDHPSLGTRLDASSTLVPSLPCYTNHLEHEFDLWAWGMERASPVPTGPA